jgi:hypothetical protein
VFGVVDPYVAGSGGSDGNGALNPLGSIWTIPAPSNGGNTLLATAAGYGNFMSVKYLRYSSTANAAVNVGPGICYYTDETFTTVSGTMSEGINGSNSSVAGFMLPNKGVVAGVGLGTTAFTAALLNGNYIFVAVGGFVPAAFLGYAGAQSAGIMGATGMNVCAATTGVNRNAAYIWGTVTSQVADILVTVGLF